MVTIPTWFLLSRMAASRSGVNMVSRAEPFSGSGDGPIPRPSTMRCAASSRSILSALLSADRTGQPRVEWDPHDVTTPDGIEIEVKSTAFLQSSAQQKTVTLSSLNSRVAPEKVTLTGLADAVRGAWD